MEILRCEDLTKKYGEKDTEVLALDHVSFSVEQGEFVSIVGPSGSGDHPYPEGIEPATASDAAADHT